MTLDEAVKERLQAATFCGCENDNGTCGQDHLCQRCQDIRAVLSALGTDMARMLIANRMLKRERDEVQARVNELEEAREPWNPSWRHDHARAEASEAREAKLRAALKPFAAFADAWDRNPLRGLHDELYTIHSGEIAGIFRLSDCKAARAALAEPAPAQEKLEADLALWDEQAKLREIDCAESRAREARLREENEGLRNCLIGVDVSSGVPEYVRRNIRAALASGETVKTVPVPPEVFERSTAEEMRALASGESREPASAGPAEEPATIKESLIVDRHARDCGCDEPGGLLCRRAHPEDPDWCPVHGWTFEACCGADKRAGEPGK